MSVLNTNISERIRQLLPKTVIDNINSVSFFNFVPSFNVDILQTPIYAEFLKFLSSNSVSVLSDSEQTNHVKKLKAAVSRYFLALRKGDIHEDPQYMVCVLCLNGKFYYGFCLCHVSSCFTDLKVIPGTVAILADCCRNNNLLENVTLPKSVVYIGAHSFDSSGLKQINLENVVRIEDCVFAYTHLKKVNLSKVTYVGAQSFHFCNLMKGDVILNSGAEIYDNLLRNF